MKKNKILLVLVLTIVLASCSNDSYVSKRHPEGESETQVSEEENTEKKEETKEGASKEENKDEEMISEEEKTDEESSEDQDPTMDGVNYEVEDVVNIRLYPTEDSDIVGEAHPGDEILFLVESDGWSRVTVNGVSGYIRNDLLKEVE